MSSSKRKIISPSKRKKHIAIEEEKLCHYRRGNLITIERKKHVTMEEENYITIEKKKVCPRGIYLSLYPRRTKDYTRGTHLSLL